MPGIFLCVTCPIKRTGILLSIAFVLGTVRYMHLIRTKKNNSIVTAIILIEAALAATPFLQQLQQQQQAYGYSTRWIEDAPMDASGENVYVVWWSNRTGQFEVMFRASHDSGRTFGDKINLSNSPDTQSRTAEILAVGNNMVFVTWWELNENVHPHTNESVLRVSTDAGQTFGPVINLGTNGTITTAGDGNSTTTATTG
jgi:hypothetical protein